MPRAMATVGVSEPTNLEGEDKHRLRLNFDTLAHYKVTDAKVVIKVRGTEFCSKFKNVGY